MRKKNDTPYPRPPIDWPMLRRVLKGHLLLISMMLFLGCLFSSIGLGVTCGKAIFGWFSGDFTCPIDFSELGQLAFGLIFLSAGIFLFYFNITSNLNSISYYYNKSQFKRHGLNIIGTVESKEENTPAEDEVERIVSYRYEFNGQNWQAADMVNNARVFAALQPGQDVPLRLLPYDPQTCIVRERSILSMLKRADRQPTQDEDDRNGRLIIFDEE